MSTLSVRTLALRLAVALCLATAGFVHAQLYVRGYRAIPYVGSSFRWDAAASFALAILLLVGYPLILRLAAIALCFGGLGGFILSRTTGLFGFVERGLQPAPQAVISILVWVVALALLVTPLIRAIARRSVRSSEACR
jgi:hypothetical protein